MTRSSVFFDSTNCYSVIVITVIATCLSGVTD